MTQEMSTIEVVEGWCRRVVADKVWLLHTTSLVIGPAEEWWDGKTRVFQSSVNELPVEGPVLKLANGHTFTANPNAFLELGGNAVGFFQVVDDRFTAFMKGAIQHAQQAKIDPEACMVLLVAVLKSHLRTLESIQTKAGN